MQRADSLINTGEYRAAYDCYNAARIFCSQKSSEVQVAQDSLFNVLNGLREREVTQREIADSLKYELESNLERVQNIVRSGEIFVELLTSKNKFSDEQMLRKYEQAISLDSQNVLLQKFFLNFLSQKDMFALDQKLVKYRPYRDWLLTITEHSFSPDGEYFFTIGGGGVGVWNLKGELDMMSLIVKQLGTKKRDIKKTGLPDFASFEFSADGRHVVTGHKNGQVKIWTLAGDLIKVINPYTKGKYRHNSDRLYYTQIKTSPSGKFGISTSWDFRSNIPIYKVWDMKGNIVREGFRWRSDEYPFEWNSYLIKELAVSDDANLLFNGHTFYNFHKQIEQDAPITDVYQARFTYDCRFLVTVGLHDSLAIMNTLGRTVQVFPLDSSSQAITSLIISRDNKLIILADEEGGVYLYSFEGKLIKKFDTGSSNSQLALSPNNRYLLTCPYGGGSVKLWSISHAYYSTIDSTITKFKFETRDQWRSTQTKIKFEPNLDVEIRRKTGLGIFKEKERDSVQVVSFGGIIEDYIANRKDELAESIEGLDQRNDDLKVKVTFKDSTKSFDLKPILSLADEVNYLLAAFPVEYSVIDSISGYELGNWDGKYRDRRSILMLTTLVQDTTIIIEESNETITAIAISPQSNKYLVAKDNFKIELRDIESKLLKTFIGNTSPIESVAFSPDEKYILSVSDNRIIVWSIEGPIWRIIDCNPSRVRKVEVSSDGKSLILYRDASAAPVTIPFPDHPIMQFD